MSPPRPRLVVVVTGTGTEVGKTWVAAALLSDLRRDRGWRVAARKPAQSFAPEDAETDADRLAAATGDAPTTVCSDHRWYARPMAPPMAADALGRPSFTVTDLAAEVTASWPLTSVDLGLVEAAGGVAAPQADDGDTVALVDALHPDLVILVADPYLGTLNLVRLSVAALGPRPVVVHLNRWDGSDDLARRNRAWLAERDGLTVTTSIKDLAAVIDAGGEAGARR